MGPNGCFFLPWGLRTLFQSSVRINVGPNPLAPDSPGNREMFQSSVRINVGPNPDGGNPRGGAIRVSILRED